jgi:hypothetical protein
LDIAVAKSLYVGTCGNEWAIRGSGRKRNNRERPFCVFRRAFFTSSFIRESKEQWSGTPIRLIERLVAANVSIRRVFYEGFPSGTEVRITHRFSIGDRIHVIGVLASFYSGKTGVVIGIEPNPDGIQELDRYFVEIPGVNIGDTKFAGFQLAAAPHIIRRAQLISD